MPVESSELRAIRNAQEPRRKCLGGWLPTCLGRGREGQAAGRGFNESAEAAQSDGREVRKPRRSGSRLVLGEVHRGVLLEPVRKAGPFRLGDAGRGRMPVHPSGNVVDLERLGVRGGRCLWEREAVERRGRDENLEGWQYCQGVRDVVGCGHRISAGTRSRLPRMSEGSEIDHALFADRCPAGCRCAKSLKRCAQEEEERCSLVLEKVKAMRCQLGEDLKKNSVNFRARQMTRDGTRIPGDAEAFCETLLSSFAKEPDIPKDLEVMIKDCFKSCIGVQNKECMVCTRDFTAKDLLTCKTSNRCRHSLYPCGHSILCGDCAEKLWQTTKKCPMCRSTMTKRPRVFKPGRWQMIGSHKE